ncbi:MAG: DNA repair protein RecO [Spirochaetia bacterium]|nr:DNA repair protein RecO [Spirochaetia bacterium]NCC89663.1 DNA repair protein RecO [Spirochaetia bacterium]
MERNVSSLGIVLHSQRYGQLNRKLTLLSVDFGIIDVVSYGARKSLKAVKAEVLTDGQFFLYYNPVKKEYTLKDLKVLDEHEVLRSDLMQTYRALFFCEMMMKTNGGDSQKAYALLSKALDLLAFLPDQANQVLIQFVHQMSELLGLRPDYRICPVCERPYEKDEIISFSSSLGSPCCKECASLDSPLLLLPGMRRYLVLTADLRFEDAVLVQLNPAAGARIKSYMLRYALLLCGGYLKTLSDGLLVSS